MLGSLEDSKSFHCNDTLMFVDVIPVASIASGSARVVVAVGLVALNVLKALALACVGTVIYLLHNDITFLEEAEDSVLAIGYNIGMVAYGAFAAVPILGNIVPALYLFRECFQILLPAL